MPTFLPAVAGFLVPSLRAHESRVAGQSAHQIEGHGDGELDDGLDDGIRRILDDDPFVGSLLGVDVIDADPASADASQAGQMIDDEAVIRLDARDDALGIFPESDDLFAAQAFPERIDGEIEAAAF